ncbi:MAG TPA: hypothetical protein VHM00_02635 [Caldimonas sp.]|jgi:hypothetical protein|nr:hypothetical protein [Caldimonas sp.]HEX2539959.1 hypothetical protein [Caldimonas sp.]
MATVEGTHTQGEGGRVVHYRVDYEVVGATINYKAVCSEGGRSSPHEGQFDFDPSKIAAAEAVAAFMQNHIGKADFDVAP